MRVLVDADLGLMAHELWYEPLALGTNNAVFVEDNSFIWTKFGNCIDANYGARYVFRYNHVTDCYIEAHSVQGNNRATRSWEIYHNQINQAVESIYCPFRLRGGTGVVYNNTLSGSFNVEAIGLDNVRSCAERPTFCDGNDPQDGNQTDEYGYPCRDQIGRSTDQWFWTSGNPYPPQLLEPAHAWNNTHGTTSVNFETIQCDESKAHIQENRDYYNGTSWGNYQSYLYPHPLINLWESGTLPSEGCYELGGQCCTKGYTCTEIISTTYDCASCCVMHSCQLTDDDNTDNTTDPDSNTDNTTPSDTNSNDNPELNDNSDSLNASGGCDCNSSSNNPSLLIWFMFGMVALVVKRYSLFTLNSSHNQSIPHTN